MKNFFSLKNRAVLGRFLRFGCVGLGLALAGAAQAQAPVWELAQGGGTPPGTSGASIINASVVDARGNVFVTGFFGGTVSFGNTRLTSIGSAGTYDVFVAKWDANVQGYTWATRGGGTGTDAGRSIAVSGTDVYVTGVFASSGNASIAGQVLAGAGGMDVFVAKYVDTSTGSTPATSSFANSWATNGGGSGNDIGYGIAVSGTNVYVTGYFVSGANARIAGQALPGAGGWDVFVAKYVDTSTGSTPATSSFTNAWATSGGGTGFDYGTGIAVSGAGVYVTGSFDSNRNASIAGQALVGAGGADVFVAKYVDTSTGSTPATSSFANAWATSGGGTASDVGQGIAVSGTGVFVTGNFYSRTGTRIAGQALVGVGLFDLFVAKYVDTSTGNTPATSSFANAWATSGGGTDSDYGRGIAVSGTDVYVTGTFFSNRNTSIAGQALTGAGDDDVFVAKYVDTSTGSTPATSSFADAWAISGGGAGIDAGQGLAVSRAGVYAVGGVNPPATFGSITLSSSVRIALNFLARLPTTFVSSTRPSNLALPALTLSPNPARAALTVGGAPAGAAVAVLDALGRQVAAAPADAAGTARLRLPAGLAAGVYVVRAGTQSARLAVE